MTASTAGHLDGNSDYGSDFNPEEEEILNRLLRQLPPKPVSDLDDDETPRATRLSRHTRYGSQEKSRNEGIRQISIEIESPASSSTISQKREEKLPDASAEETPRPDPEPNVLSPLKRFRTKPKKALSVTDLVSPSWCELQFWYTLTMPWRKKRTPAMTQGTQIHKTLEEQVHRVVTMDVKTKEDGWSLRLWNVIQGLRTLRKTGMTRELEVWGIIDGQVVNGVIDELSCICPDRSLEDLSRPVLINKNLPAGQTRITDHLEPKPESASEGSRGVLRNNLRVSNEMSRIYLTDVKTRRSNTLPRGAAFRPTMMQLMLYHRLLSDSAEKRTDPAVFFDRYSLQANIPFSDALFAQLAAMNNENPDNVPSESLSPSKEASSSFTEPELSSTTIAQDTTKVFLSHNSLEQLWTLMMDEIALTMPKGAASIGSVLQVEYRAQDDGNIIGSKTFLHNDNALQTYLEDGMSWWKGEREARGVCVEEAFKCGSCDFAEECDWRKTKIGEATQSYRARTRSTI